MADLTSLEDRLKEIGCNFRFWGRSELRELADIIMPNEIVEHCVNGQYQGGFAMLVATDQRVLLIDKKPMYLSLEDIRYDMISEVDYNHRMLDANVLICTPNKELRFIAFNQGRLRKLFHFVQTRVMEIRQQYQQMAMQQMQAMQQNAQFMGAMQPIQQVLTKQQANDTPATEPTNEVEQPTARQADAEPIRQASFVPTFHRPLVAPIISAYTRLPMLSKQRRFLGSRALSAPMSSIYRGYSGLSE